MFSADSENALDVCYDWIGVEGGRVFHFADTNAAGGCLNARARARKIPSRLLFRQRCQTFSVSGGHQEASAQHARPHVRLAATHPVAIGGGLIKEPPRCPKREPWRFCFWCVGRSGGLAMTSLEPQSAAPPPPRSPFHFGLPTLLLLVVVLGSSIAVFGVGGIAAFAVTGLLAIYLREVRLLWRLSYLVLTLLCLILGLGLFLPAIGAPREAGRRASCFNHMHQLGLALQSYYERNKTFPSAYTTDKDSKPRHSWRTLMLPYMQCTQRLFSTTVLI